MKVALIHDYLHTFGGAEQVLLALTEVYPDADIYTFIKNLKKFPQDTKERFDNKKIISSNFSKLPFSKFTSKLLVPLTKQWFENLDLSDYELIISDGTIWSKGVKTNKNQKHIYYCHTPARFLYNLPSESEKKTELFFLKPIVKKIEQDLAVWDLQTSNNPNIIIANSINTKTRIKNFWNKESVVIYPPVNLLNFDKFAKIEDYYLVVSRLEPYKNIDKVIEVFNLLGWKLKVVGTGSEKVGLKMLANKNIEFLEGIDNQKLEKLYIGAKGLILSAVEEDFGITTIEACSVGTPVIALRSGGFIETVIEGKNGIFYDNNTVESLLEAVKKFNQIQFDREVVYNTVKDKYTKQVFKTKIIELVNSLTSNI